MKFVSDIDYPVRTVSAAEERLERKAANLQRAHECMVEAKQCLQAEAITTGDEPAEMLAGVLNALMGTAQEISFAAQREAGAMLGQ